MEPENVQAESRLAPLKKVTPLSKYLALVLFMVMPFIGGWIGYTYAPEKVVIAETVVIKENEQPHPDSFGTLDLSDNWIQGQNSDFTNSSINRVISVRTEMLNPGQSCKDFLKPWNYGDLGNPNIGPKVIASNTEKIKNHNVGVMILGDYPVSGPNITEGIVDGTITEWRTYDLCAESEDGTQAFVMTYKGGREADQELDTALAKQIFASALE